MDSSSDEEEGDEEEGSLDEDEEEDKEGDNANASPLASAPAQGTKRPASASEEDGGEEGPSPKRLKQ